jgi:hypothetical protein
MADWKKQDDEEYINEESADSQQDPDYAENGSASEEQYTSPEKMQKPRHDRDGKLSQTQGWKG